MRKAIRRLGMAAWVVGAIVLLSVIVAGCEDNLAPSADSDSEQDYRLGDRIPVDDAVYTILGVVAGDLESITRQTQPAYGSASGVMTGGFGYMGGAYYGAEYGGKGIVRLLVTGSDTPEAPVGATVILKVTDLKALVLVPGDRVAFKCRRQYEAIAAVREQETLDVQKVETWELDYCRLVSPVIISPE